MKNLNFKVDKEKCVKCGLCASDCISKVIKLGEDGYPYAEKNECLGCQHCLAICPTGAISVFDRNPENSAIIENLPTVEQMEALIKYRRSCRQFKQENIDSETIEKLKDIINWVPTGCNFKDLHISVVEDYKKMDWIKEKIYNKLKFILKFLPLTGFFATCKKEVLAGKDVIFVNAPHMIVMSVNKKAPCKAIDPIIALSYFELYAQSLGIGTLWCGFATHTLPIDKNVMKELKIPKTHEISYVMMFGYPKIEYKRSIQP